MATWKKVLVSGSQIEVLGITGSDIPNTGTGTDKVLVVDNDGKFITRDQSDVQGVTTAIFGITGSDPVNGRDAFDATGDSLLFTGSSTTILVSESHTTGQTKLDFQFAGTVFSSSAQLPSGIISGAAQLPAGILSSSEQIATEISESFVAASSSIATDINNLESDISTNSTAISNNAAAGIRVQGIAGEAGPSGSSISLFETASFIGTADEIEVSHSITNASESVIQIGLPDDVQIGNNLAVSGALTVLGIELVEGETSTIAGQFFAGTASLPSAIDNLGGHQFTGSVNITGALDVTETVTIGNLAEDDSIETLTNLVIHDGSNVLKSAGTGIIATLQGLTASLATTVDGNTNDITAAQGTASLTATSASQGIHFKKSGVAQGFSTSLLGTASFAATNNFSSQGFNVTASSDVVTFELGSDLLLGVGLISESSQVDLGQAQGTAQNVFSTMSIIALTGSTTSTQILADASNDILSISGGNNISITATPGTDTITFSSTDQDVNVANLIDRLDEINSNYTIGVDANTDGTISGDLTVSKNLIVNGDFTVIGDQEITTIRTTNTEIEDQFILINSGSLPTNVDADKDGGFVFDTGNGVGTLFYYDFSAKAFAIRGATQEAGRTVSGSFVSGDGGGEAIPDLYLNTVSQSQATPSAAPAYGAAAGGTNVSDTRLGSLHINSSNGEIFIYS